ncbi:HAD-IIIC family phosphatase [Lipingzhangella sp. LS1_29]|uniref:HAD-IIIC family phosphatase n=1 Tax=Lipingzhangella rawalii TaxID=2055835 RepID=A0ABU2H6H5_9ACTN|nr:HAD-IIIC family phosphatase [Lipingzhangella rawalii]MDS1270912.1 HAD-IIIC family phosphatase [Lipingzhangella rawalii]
MSIPSANHQPHTAHRGAAQTPHDAWTEIRRMRDEGRLVAAFPEMCSLVARLDRDGRARAGALLAGLDHDSITAAHPEIPTLTTVVTGNGTSAALRAPLAAEFARHGLALRLTGHGHYFADLGDPQGAAFQTDTELTVCLLDTDAVTQELGAVWTVEDCERALGALASRVRTFATEHDRKGSGVLVLTTVALPTRISRQLVDHRSRARLGRAWREFNSTLLGLGVDLDRCVVIDLDTHLTDAVALDDARLRTYAKVGLSEPLLQRVAEEAAGVAGTLRGRVRKCLVVDLDGTLWDGILGDDGVDGVHAGGSGRGAAFAEFQKVIAQLGSQGVMLAVCSKNEEEQVRQALCGRPAVALGEEDFVAIAANWSPKDLNIVTLTQSLNIGTDSLVFVDDSAFEVGLVRRALPDVGVVELDDEPALHPERLLAGDWFTTLRLTEEDRSRAERYRAEARRTTFRAEFSSHQDYLAELDLEVGVFRPGTEDMARIAQMTQRTNQFNLTTIRMDTAQVAEYDGGADTAVWGIHSADRFGDHGIVGVLFLRTPGDGFVVVENALLSCRVFARGIEDAVLACLLRQAVAEGGRVAVGLYRPTRKNHGFADFYPRHGFRPDDGAQQAEAGDKPSWMPTEDSTVRRYRHDLSALPAVPAHVTMTTLPEGVFHDRRG